MTGAGATILVVDDEDGVRRLASEVLVRAGYEVLEAASGEAAMAVVEAHAGPIDLLLTDVRMPGMTGRELAARLTAARPGLRVIYMSGYAGGVFGPRGVLDPKDLLLEKPFRATALATLVAETLRPPG